VVTSVGQLLINEALPEDLRDYQRRLDKKGLKDLLREVMRRYPDRYKEIVHRLGQLGADFATSTGSSFSLRDLRSSQTKQRIVSELEGKIRRITAHPSWSDEAKNNKIIELLASRMDEMREGTHAEGLAEGNSFSRAVLSGARGNPANLSSLRGADLMVLDHRDRPIPIPITHSFSEGLSPAEYFAGAYGTRKGIVSTKMATAEAGFLGKQLANAAGRLVVTDEDPVEGTGYPVDTDDPDNEGAILARPYGEFGAGTVLTPSILQRLRKDHDEILVHSPISAGGSGVPRLAAGVRERGGISPVGDNIGIAASQAVSEPISQSQLSSKHTAGVGGAKAATLSGFQAINQLVQIPKSFQNAATVARMDGRVGQIEEAPQGGRYVWVGDEKHYVYPGVELEVKVGDTITAGDALSEGVPNPAEVVKYKHIGEGRDYLVRRLRQTLRDQGIAINRRNLELVARGLINHVRVVESDGVEDALPDDVIPYDELARRYRPRFGNMALAPARSRNKYLGRPALHYSIGTRVTPQIFEPHMVRAMESTVHDPDWFRRLGGFYIGKGFSDAVQRGGKSEIHGQNWGHSLARGREFGQQLETEGVY
jgi:DNA-directed RNA polymerase subunit beta'